MRFVQQLGRSSILIRLAVAMGAIVLLALGSIIASAVLAEASSGKAQLINLTGSLRMQVYVIATRVADAQSPPAEKAAALERALGEFEARLKSPALLANLPGDREDPLRRDLRSVEVDWSEVVKPLARTAAADPQWQGRFLAEAHALVARIDALVGDVERQLEGRFRWLRAIQVASLLLIVAAVATAVYIMHVQVLRIVDLLASARAVRRGRFDVKVAHEGPDELGQLGEAFNRMVADLSRMYADLEARVAEKTGELGRSNQSLELLYDTIRTLTERELTQDALAHVLGEVERVVGASAGAICARGEEPDEAAPLAGEILPGGTRPWICAETSCAQCLGVTSVVVRPVSSGDGSRIVSIPLHDAGRPYGVLSLRLAAGVELAPWQMQLLEAVGRHIGAALAMARRSDERHRLALFEERSVIARELHDSLAQSLSYLKIQITRLQALREKAAPPAQIDGVVGDLRNGLNNAYRQLRELLTTFRLRVDGRGLAAALEDTVREFEARAGLAITLDNRLLGVELGSHEEVHVLQVIREALSNVEHHAQASRVQASLERLADGTIRVRVDDDGIGIRQRDPTPHHYGLVIMQDRAMGLNGMLTVANRETGGTRVELQFRPRSAMREAGDTQRLSA